MDVKAARRTDVTKSDSRLRQLQDKAVKEKRVWKASLEALHADRQNFLENLASANIHVGEVRESLAPVVKPEVRNAWKLTMELEAEWHKQFMEQANVNLRTIQAQSTKDQSELATSVDALRAQRRRLSICADAVVTGRLQHFKDRHNQEKLEWEKSVETMREQRSSYHKSVLDLHDCVNDLKDRSIQDINKTKKSMASQRFKSEKKQLQNSVETSKAKAARAWEQFQLLKNRHAQEKEDFRSSVKSLTKENTLLKALAEETEESFKQLEKQSAQKKRVWEAALEALASEKERFCQVAREANRKQELLQKQYTSDIKMWTLTVEKLRSERDQYRQERDALKSENNKNCELIGEANSILDILIDYIKRDKADLDSSVRSLISERENFCNKSAKTAELSRDGAIWESCLKSIDPSQRNEDNPLHQSEIASDKDDDHKTAPSVDSNTTFLMRKLIARMNDLQGQSVVLSESTRQLKKLEELHQKETKEWKSTVNSEESKKQLRQLELEYINDKCEWESKFRLVLADKESFRLAAEELKGRLQHLREQNEKDNLDWEHVSQSLNKQITNQKNNASELNGKIVKLEDQIAKDKSDWKFQLEAITVDRNNLCESLDKAKLKMKYLAEQYEEEKEMWEHSAMDLHRRWEDAEQQWKEETEQRQKQMAKIFAWNAERMHDLEELKREKRSQQLELESAKSVRDKYTVIVRGLKATIQEKECAIKKEKKISDSQQAKIKGRLEEFKSKYMKEKEENAKIKQNLEAAQIKYTEDKKTWQSKNEKTKIRLIQVESQFTTARKQWKIEKGSLQSRQSSIEKSYAIYKQHSNVLTIEKVQIQKKLELSQSLLINCQQGLKQDWHQNQDISMQLLCL